VDGYTAAIGCSSDRVLVTYPELGNVSGASIPITLDIARRRGCVHPGDWLLMPAVGAGMAWSAAAYRWSE
jgi:3-oxoacyl-[acyl-carrier-protein] synthase III